MTTDAHLSVCKGSLALCMQKAQEWLNAVTGSGFGAADASAQATATAKATAQSIANAIAKATSNNAQVESLRPNPCHTVKWSVLNSAP